MLLDPRRIRRGNTVTVRYEIRDGRAYPPGRLIDPSGGTRITIFEPSGAVAVLDAVMSKVTTHPDFPQGLYEFLFQTGEVSPLGSWMAECEETHEAYTNVSRREIAFILEP
jgi:hypothetical protein